MFLPRTIHPHSINIRTSRPAFSPEFVAAVREMHAFTSVFGHLAGDPDLEHLYDRSFAHFVKSFGTHYMEEVTVGARLSVFRRFYQTEAERCASNLIPFAN